MTSPISRLISRLLSVLLVASATGAQGSLTCPSADSIAARSSGTAPLFVFFDGCGSGASISGSDTCNLDATLTNTNQSFRDLLFRWNFGDSTAGTWGDKGIGYADGKPRNSETGPEAGHLFETPGTYTVSLTVSNVSGETCSVQTTITVADPAITYAGAATVCISATTTPVAGAGGCPTGAAVMTNADFHAGLAAAIGAGAKRILFNTGDAFTVNAQSGGLGTGPGYIGSYGGGPMPTVTDSRTGMNLFAYILDFTSAVDWVATGIHYIPNAAMTAGTNIGIFWNSGSTQVATQITILRNQADNYDNAHGFTQFLSGNDGPGDGTAWRQTALIENTYNQVGDPTPNTVSYSTYAAVNHSAWLGNLFGSATPNLSINSHVSRFSCGHHFLLAHSKHLGMTDTAMTIHAAAFGCVATNFWSVSDNYVQNDGSAGSIASGPTCDSCGVETIADGIIERNELHVKAGSGGAGNGQIEVQGSSRIVVRNNTCDETNSTGQCVFLNSTHDTGSTLNPESAIEVYNNSAFSPDNNPSGQNGTVGGDPVGSSQHVSGTIIRNNLYYAPNQTAGQVVILPLPGGWTSSTYDHNMAIASPTPFVSSAPSVATDFRLVTGSGAIGAGTNLGEPPNVPVFNDFGLNTRTSPTSAGAWEVAANFIASPTLGRTPLQVGFTDTSTGGPTSWNWTFGDGGTSTTEDPLYTYQTPGSYTVSLTVGYPGGGSITKTVGDCIAIYPPYGGAGACGLGVEVSLLVAPIAWLYGRRRHRGT